MPAPEFNPHYIQSLQLLLTTGPETNAADGVAIVTAAPRMWDEIETGSGLLIDVSSIIGGRSPWGRMRQRYESQLEQQVYDDLLRAGWPQHSLQCGWRVDAKRAIAIDIAVLDQNADVVVAVEVARTSKSPNKVEEWRQFVFDETDIAWTCVTDGEVYELISRNGRALRLDAPPTAADLGLADSVNSTRQFPSTSNAVVPKNVAAFQAIMEEHAPSRILIDFTIPWGLRVQRDAPVMELLPPDLRRHAHIEAVATLLVSFAQQDCVSEIYAVCPPSVAWAHSFQSLREWLQARLGLAAHIELPPGMFAPMTQIGASLFILGGHRSAPYFNAISSPEELLGMQNSAWFTSLRDALSGNSASVGFVKDAARLESWSVSANDPAVDRIRDRVANLGERRTIGELFEVSQGVHVPKDAILKAEDSGEVEILDARMLRHQARGDWTDQPKFVGSEFSIRDRDILQVGDLLLPRIWTEASRVISFESSNLTIANSSLIVMRPCGEVATSRMVLEFLNSSMGKRLLQSIASGTAVTQLSVKSIRDLPVPDIGIDLSKSLDEIETIGDRLRARADELDAKRRSLFDSPSPNEFRERLGELQRRGEVLSESLSRADSLEFQISQFYPFPIAYAYRLLASFANPHEKYREQLRVAENLLSFVGTVAIALLADDDRMQLSEHLVDGWQGGISPGHWKAITSRCSKPLADYEKHPLGNAISRLKVGSDKKGLGKELAQLIIWKNDFKHDRGPKIETDLISHSEQLQECLTMCMEKMAFWTRFPIRLIRDIDADRRSPGHVRLNCSRISGDHPGFQREDLTWGTPLTKRDLYIEVTTRYWVPLYPFLQVMSCPHCKVDEIYFVDRWDGRGSPAVMKSFERGHSQNCQETGDELARLVLG